MESTPNGAYGCFYEEWGRARLVSESAKAVVRHFFPWWMEEAYVALRLQSCARMSGS